MKEKDLMIGNYYIDEDGEQHVCEARDFSWMAWGYCGGVPLTEEWLVKFGFFEKYKSCFNRWNKKGFSLNDNEDDNGDLQGVFYYDFKLEIKHVHQLQNLYKALTGEELTIKE